MPKLLKTGLVMSWLSLFVTRKHTYVHPFLLKRYILWWNSLPRTSSSKRKILNEGWIFGSKVRLLKNQIRQNTCAISRGRLSAYLKTNTHQFDDFSLNYAPACFFEQDAGLKQWDLCSLATASAVKSAQNASSLQDRLRLNVPLSFLNPLYNFLLFLNAMFFSTLLSLPPVFFMCITVILL